jgi:hypothetical protein
MNLLRITGRLEEVGVPRREDDEALLLLVGEGVRAV